MDVCWFSMLFLTLKIQRMVGVWGLFFCFVGVILRKNESFRPLCATVPGAVAVRRHLLSTQDLFTWGLLRSTSVLLRTVPLESCCSGSSSC